MQFFATTVQGPHHSIFGAYTIPPFRFQPRNRSMDWRRMSVLDVDRVTRELDVATLKENLTDITFCTLDREVCSHCSQPLDQALLNVLRLAQLSIEYLMHCQDFLTTRVDQLELQASLRQQSQNQQELDCQAEELRHLREERRQQRKMIKDLQQLLRWSGGQSYYMCHLCEKTFPSASFLWSHLQHRHEGVAQGEKQKQKESMEEVVRDLRAQLTSTQEELTALLKNQRELQEAKSARQRERDVKALFQEWEEELYEELDQQKRVFWDELKSSVLPNSPLEENPRAPQSCSEMCSPLGSLQDSELLELLRQIQEIEALEILKDTEIQLQDKIQELQRENKMLWRENKLQEEKEKTKKENEKLQKRKEELQNVNEKLRKKKEKIQKEKEKIQKEKEKILKEKEKIQKKTKKIQKEKEKIQKESEKVQKESEKVQKEYEKLLEEKEKLKKDSEKLHKKNEKLQKNNEKLKKENERLHDMLCQLDVTASQSQQHMSFSTQMQQQGRLITSQEMDAKEDPMSTSTFFMNVRGEKKKGRFSEWCSRASERAARWFSGSRKRARQR